MNVTVIIPARNEAESIGPLLGELIALGYANVVVVDNGSTDGTPGVARAAGAEVIAEPVPGYGRACLSGAAHASEGGADTFVFLDGDGSDRPEDIPPLLAALEAGAELAIGVRRGPAVERGSIAPAARFGNRLSCTVMAALWGRSVHDLSPLKAIRAETFARIAPRDQTYGWTVELLATAVARECRIAEVDVGYRRRRGGTSKVSGQLGASLRAGMVILSTLARVRVRTLGAPALGMLAGFACGLLLVVLFAAWLLAQGPASRDVWVAPWLLCWPVLLVAGGLGRTAGALAARRRGAA